ncbi:MAG: hypothetical protein GC162_00530 [Planctomycetes bacterium]|nr:hypothetical protein [Planctomycetota bacterium]
MRKIAIVLLADTVSTADIGRMVSALTAAEEFIEAGDEVEIMFDGAGTKWPIELSMPMHGRHELFNFLRDRIMGVCASCAEAYGMKHYLENLDLPLADEHRGHISLRSLAARGFTILTF